MIGDGCRLDNLVHIAHNVRLGRSCVIVAQVGIAGSTVLEDSYRSAARRPSPATCASAPAPRSRASPGVMSDLEPGAHRVGTPAQPKTQAFRQIAWLKRMSSQAPGGLIRPVSA
ncbi:MAG: hypothetical protein WDN45_07705 [Caulobacteraceae bacterium]